MSPAVKVQMWVEQVDHTLISPSSTNRDDTKLMPWKDGLRKAFFRRLSGRKQEKCHGQRILLESYMEFQCLLWVKVSHQCSPALHSSPRYSPLCTQMQSWGTLQRFWSHLLRPPGQTKSQSRVLIWPPGEHHIQPELRRICPEYPNNIIYVFTCCSIIRARLAPSLSSLSGEGKLRKDETSGGREEITGVDNFKGKKREKKKGQRSKA